MSRSGGKKVIALLVCCAYVTIASAAQGVSTTTIDGLVVTEKPFMLFVTPLLPPEGKERAEAFSKACSKYLKEIFANTSFQVVLVQSVNKVDSVSNQKKDILLTTDTLDCYFRGAEYDTLVVWIRYRVGLLNSRVDIPFKKGNEAMLPKQIADGAYKAICDDFTGVVELDGGPEGMTMTLVEENVTIMPPRTMLFPPGDYLITSYYPDFRPRSDTLIVNQGRTTKKRILLLPQ